MPNRALIAAALFPVALLIISCDNGVDTVDVDRAPPSVKGLSVETGAGVLLLKWDFLDEVSPQLSFSGYQVYLEREDWDDGFGIWASFRTRPGSGSYLPLVKRTNSFSPSRMEIPVVGLRNGLLHRFYVAGVQNGYQGPPSIIVEDVPYRQIDHVQIREETRLIPDWYIPGYGAEDELFHQSGPDRIGYAYDRETKSHFLRFESIEEGGRLRLQSAGREAGTEDAPTDGDGAPIGYHDDHPALDRIRIEEGDYLFVWNTNGTEPWRGDDHYSRIFVSNIVEIHDDRKITIDVSYQPRADTPNL